MTSSSWRLKDTYELCNNGPFGAKVSLAVLVSVAGRIPRQLPQVTGGLDHRLGVRRHIHFRPLVAPRSGPHDRVPGLLDMRQDSGIFQHLAGGRFLEHALAIHLGIVVQSSGNQGDDEDATQGPLAASAFLFFCRGLLFVLLLLRAALLLDALHSTKLENY